MSLPVGHLYTNQFSVEIQVCLPSRIALFLSIVLPTWVWPWKRNLYFAKSVPRVSSLVSVSYVYWVSPPAPVCTRRPQSPAWAAGYICFLSSIYRREKTKTKLKSCQTQASHTWPPRSVRGARRPRPGRPGRSERGSDQTGAQEKLQNLKTTFKWVSHHNR